MMNQWRKCLQCWIPVSKKNDKKSVMNHVEETEPDEPDVPPLLPSDISAQSIPVPVGWASSTVVSSADGSVSWSLPPTERDVEVNGAETNNYIPLEECFSGQRTTRQQTLPKLFPKDIHLLDLVPPSPCSLTDNFRSLSGMPEVYTPMSPFKMASRPSRGYSTSSTGFGTRGTDGVYRTQQQVAPPQCLKHSYYSCGAGELTYSDNAVEPDLSLKADFRNNNTCYSAKNGHLVNSKSDVRVARISISSEKSIIEETSCCASHYMSDHPECQQYYNFPSNNTERHCDGKNCSSTCTGCSEKPTKHNPTVSSNVESSEPEPPAYALNDPPNQSKESLKKLHMTPPAPPQNNRVRVHKYINTPRDSTSSSHGHGPLEGSNSCNSAFSYSEEVSPRSSLSHSESDTYYNVVPSSNGLPFPPDSALPPPLPPLCHGPSRHSSKKQPRPRPHLRHDSLQSQSPDGVVLPIRKCSKNNFDSSSSNDEDDSSSGRSATNSNVSLNKSINSSLLKSFSAVLPAPPQQPHAVEYLQLALDEPGGFTRTSLSGTLQRSQNSTIDYIEIDPCRTKALSDAKKQFDSNRHNGKTCH